MKNLSSHSYLKVSFQVFKICKYFLNTPLEYYEDLDEVTVGNSSKVKDQCLY